jgi:hypothetical protein
MKKLYYLIILFCFSCVDSSQYYQHNQRYYASSDYLNKKNSKTIGIYKGSSNSSLDEAKTNSLKFCDESSKHSVGVLTGMDMSDVECRIHEAKLNPYHPDNQNELKQLAEIKKREVEKIIKENEKIKFENEYGRYISQCEYIGFKRNTEKMGDCVLKISQTEKKMVDIQVSNSGGDSVANLILLQESLKLLQPPSNPRRNVQCTYNTVGGILGVNCF